MAQAGDSVLFSRKGRVIVGTEGCSRFFMLGLVDIAAPDELTREMEELRASLLADLYFRGVPSMQPEARKTALLLHAKDDVPEVRREAFGLLRRSRIRFFAAVRDKAEWALGVRFASALHPAYRYGQNDLYDGLVSPLFRHMLHKGDRYEICFARRGRADRTAALREALEAARRRFCDKWNIAPTAQISVVSCSAAERAGLQAADYLLWALQRLYERGEDR